MPPPCLRRAHDRRHLLIAILMLVPEIVLLAVDLHGLAPERRAVAFQKHHHDFDDLVERREEFGWEVLPLCVGEEGGADGAGADGLPPVSKM